MSNQSDSSSIWVEFTRGLTKPSVFSVVSALAVMAVLSVTYCIVFSSSFLASERYRYLMVDGYDTQTYVSHKVLSRANQIGSSIVVLGNSVAIRCIESEDALSNRVREITGIHLPANNFATDAQSVWEMIEITNQHPPGPGGILVVALTPPLLAIDADGPTQSSLTSLLIAPKLGFSSHSLVEEARYLELDTPISIGIYAIQNANFFIARRKTLLKNLLRGGIDYADPLTAPWYELVSTPAFHAQEIAMLPDLITLYDLNIRSNLDAITRMVARARTHGDFSLIIMEAPVHPGWWDTPLGSAFHDRYRDDLRQLAASLNGTIMLATEAAALKRSDFVDYEGHLGNAAARRRCNDALAETTALVMRGKV